MLGSALTIAEIARRVKVSQRFVIFVMKQEAKKGLKNES